MTISRLISTRACWHSGGLGKNRLRLLIGRLVGVLPGPFYWSEREDLNLRPLVSQTSALTGLRHAPMPFP